MFPFLTKRDEGIYLDKQSYPPYQSQALKVGRAFGYMYDYEILLMQAIVRSLPEHAKIVNIGAGSGTSGVAIVEARPDLADTTWTVDISPGGTPFGGLLNESNVFNAGSEGSGLPRPQQILGDSSEVGRTWDKGPLNFVFVDANHSGESVAKDIEAWKPHLIPGGYMMFHDYNHGVWGAVKPTVDNLMGDWIRIAVVDLSAIFMNV